jgi:hypothetical protein
VAAAFGVDEATAFGADADAALGADAADPPLVPQAAKNTDTAQSAGKPIITAFFILFSPS